MRDLLPSLAAQLYIERQIVLGNSRFVIGVDEVGRGSWAGPLCVGVVLYDLDLLLKFMSELTSDIGTDESSKAMRSKYLRVNDSKLLSPKLRLTLDQPIKELARGYGLGFVDPAELDAIGMSKGLTLGLERALVPIRDFVDSSVLLLDGKVNFSRYLQVKTFVKGDCQSFAIASASIIAKVARDELMARESENYPWYVFEKNKGYPSPMHVSALHAVGPSQIHRRSWSFMADLPWQPLVRHQRLPS